MGATAVQGPVTSGAHSRLPLPVQERVNWPLLTTLCRNSGGNLVNQPNYSVTARPYCCAWSAGIVSGLGASTFSHGPFTVGAACASAFSALKINREVRVPN